MYELMPTASDGNSTISGLNTPPFFPRYGIVFAMVTATTIPRRKKFLLAKFPSLVAIGVWSSAASATEVATDKWLIEVGKFMNDDWWTAAPLSVRLGLAVLIFAADPFRNLNPTWKECTEGDKLSRNTNRRRRPRWKQQIDAAIMIYWHIGSVPSLIDTEHRWDQFEFHWSRSFLIFFANVRASYNLILRSQTSSRPL